MIDLGLQPNAQMLWDHVSVLFLHHLLDLVLVSQGKKPGNTGIWMRDGEVGSARGFGTVSPLWYLI